MALLVSSGPLSETQLTGFPWRGINASSSRATLAPDSDVSGISAKLSRVKSSTTARMRKRRPSMRQSETKSRDQRSLGRSAAAAARVHRAHACAHYAGALAAFPRGRAGENACGSCAVLLVSASHVVAGSRSDAAERRALECGAAQRRRLHDHCGSAWMSDRYTSVCTPAAHSLRVLHTHELRPPAEQRASPLSVVDVLQDGIVEHSLSEKLLQLR